MRRHDIVNLLGLANWRGLDITECIIGNGLNGGIRYDEESLVEMSFCFVVGFGCIITITTDTGG